ncbi:hypothetical protein O181_034444 [Austropuccinia psidii MF-1]|uniref:Uncharacterized protein n=1 Tax=Austropuccinia psidii MF-1 TaxID=1389203 RepID=A0A9Q3D0R2_9BASI|nr:hypothetical protein [Austropuccinia psidii MF-1]
MSRPEKQHLTRANLACIKHETSQKNKCSSEASREKNYQSACTKRAQGSGASTSRYSLRSHSTNSTILILLPFTHDRNSLVASHFPSDDNLDSTPMGDETPRLTKDKLEVLQELITQTKFPSWFSCITGKLDFKNFQTLKTADWQILMTLYLPLAWVPIWSSQIHHREERVDDPGSLINKDLLLKLLISLDT